VCLFYALLNKRHYSPAPYAACINRLIESSSASASSAGWPTADLEIKRLMSLADMDKMDKAAAREIRSVVMMFGRSCTYSMISKFHMLPAAASSVRGLQSASPCLREFVDIVTKDRSLSCNSRPQVTGSDHSESGDTTTTENVLMAAARNDGEVVIKMASANFMVQDLCFFLKKLGVKVDGIGTSTLAVLKSKKYLPMARVRA